MFTSKLPNVGANELMPPAIIPVAPSSMTGLEILVAERLSRSGWFLRFTDEAVAWEAWLEACKGIRTPVHIDRLSSGYRSLSDAILDVDFTSPSPGTQAAKVSVTHTMRTARGWCVSFVFGGGRSFARLDITEGGSATVTIGLYERRNAVDTQYNSWDPLESVMTRLEAARAVWDRHYGSKNLLA